jgi:hypothetical protein
MAANAFFPVLSLGKDKKIRIWTKKWYNMWRQTRA